MRTDTMLVAMARFRLEWAKLWAEVGFSLIRWANKEIPRHSRTIREWEDLNEGQSH